MVCQFLLYNKVNQLYVYIYPLIPSLFSLPLTLPIPPLQVVTKHRADLPVLCSSFPLAIYFTFGRVHMSMLLSYFVPASPSHPVSSILFSTSASLFLPCHQVHHYRFFRFHICALAMHDFLKRRNVFELELTFNSCIISELNTVTITWLGGRWVP